MKQTIQIELSPENLKAMISEAVSTAIADLKQTDEMYLTIEDVRKRFHLQKKQSVHDWINKGILKAYKISGKTLFKKEEVDQAVIEKVICKHKHTSRR